MKKLVTILIFSIIIISCSSEKEEIITGGLNVDIEIDIKYINQDGLNLLDGVNGIIESEINIYHKINNEWVEYFESNLDNPKGILIGESEDGKLLVLYPSQEIIENNFSETKIEFTKQYESDIIKTEFDFSNGNTYLEKVWVNGELKWEANETKIIIEIVK